ncbi:NAD-dependent epimerase/dehydratase family protein, partial [Patescibacteria group bacterium]|nr:NAD-dependent epimerase/dehydratase family protein [Patescibacteria group bacterium]
MKILVTGGAGYIGGITAHLLTNEGHEVVIFDNLSVGDKRQVDFLELPLIKGDLIKPKDLEKALDSSFDAVVHFAARTEAGLSLAKPLEFFENNVVGLLNTLNAAKNCSPPPKFIYLSSNKVYGTKINSVFLEESST